MFPAVPQLIQQDPGILRPSVLVRVMGGAPTEELQDPLSGVGNTTLYVEEEEDEDVEKDEEVEEVRIMIFVA